MFSLVLPAYNEARNLEKCVREVKRAFRKMGEEYEIIIAEDGSTDGTDRIARRLSKEKGITHMHSDRKLGRGLALRRAFSKARGMRMGYIDVDLATDMKHFSQLVMYSKKYDVVTGSRYMPGSDVERPGMRRLASSVHGMLLRVFLGVKIMDPQCGFKAFSREFVQKEMAGIKENSWAWDEIVMVEAAKKGYSVKEFPVKWGEKKEKKHSAGLGRLWKDTKLHGRALLKLFLKWRLGMKVQI